ncbi:MAG: ATP-dependent DNA helicase RecG [Dehalococcoidia bacterium]|nr:ATP-dependent DNA helicase RecG [Dehalococcoidia bacterium]
MNRVANRQTPARRGPASRSTESEGLVRFRKVLDLELRRGCDDGAVIGGIDRFLSIAKQDKGVISLINAAPSLGKPYAEMTAAQRTAWLRSLLATKPSTAKTASSTRPARASGRADSGPEIVTPAPASSDPLDAPVTVVKGVKGVLQAKLAKLSVRSVRDLLYLFPNRHNDFANVRPIAELEPDEEQTALVSVWSATKVRLGRREGTQAVVGDDTGTMRVVWFNQPYLADQLKTNDRIVLAGKVTLFNRLKTMESPEWERLQSDDLTHTGRLVPVYPLTQGLSQRVLRRAVKEAVDRFSAFVREPLPADLRQRHQLLGLREALRQMHYPESAEKHEIARRRIAFEELLRVQLAVLERRLAWEEGRAPAFALDGVLEVYRSGLPFALTGAQERVLTEIVSDIQTTRPMARLLQGDVGSGKTAVAGAALVIAAFNGYQGALMAPTEILAEQHHRTLSKLIGGLALRGPSNEHRQLRVELLTGSMTARAKREVAEAVATGQIDVVVGTHALIQEGISFRRLGLAVVDEQHRFGVMQRAALRERIVDHVSSGPNPGLEADASAARPRTPHLLVMSATPIPRTLALTFFGDLDVSVIDEMPPGRLPVSTRWVGPDERAEAYGFVREQVQQGRQVFIVCPLIDESPALQTRSATQEYERLARHVFPELRLGLLHGRMAARDKEAVLQSFRRGELDILVATTVIEVGIDIPNATVMVIEGADRFGLAQMHQLRGRVGRGAGQSFCLLLSDDPSEGARARLQLLEELSDGFALAEADLRLRGPGDYFGTRQSGLPEFQAADFSDVKLIESARQEAMALLKADPGLRQPEHALLAASVAKAKRTVTGEVS